MTGVLALYPNDRPMTDGRAAIVFKDEGHAQWCVRRMGWDPDQFTYLKLTGVSSGLTRAYNRWLRLEAGTQYASEKRRETSGEGPSPSGD